MNYAAAVGPFTAAITTPLDLPLPAAAAPAGLQVDWQVQAPPRAADDRMQVTVDGGRCTVCLCGVAEFTWDDGADTVAGTFCGETERWRTEHLRDMLLLPALEAVLLARGVLTLHAAAVMRGDALALCLGPSGAGKSTLAEMLAARGGTLFSDDRVILHGNRLYAWPAGTVREVPPRLLLLQAVYEPQAAASCVQPLAPAVAGAAALAATRWAGAPGAAALPGFAAATARLLELVAAARARRVVMRDRDHAFLSDIW